MCVCVSTDLHKALCIEKDIAGLEGGEEGRGGREGRKGGEEGRGGREGRKGGEKRMGDSPTYPLM